VHPRVLLVGDAYYASLAAVRGLRLGGYEPWLATSASRTYASRSRAIAGTVLVPDPARGEGPFVGALISAAARFRAAAVLPATESALVALAGRQGDFPAGIALGGGSPAVVARAGDKVLLAAFAAEAGLHSPVSETIRTADLPARADVLGYPLVVKPVRSAVTVDGATIPLPPARLVHGADELAGFLGGLPATDWLAQRHVPGQLYAVSGVAMGGELVCAVHQVARRIYPRLAGASAFAETVPRDQALEAKIAALVGAIGWSGIYEAQLIRTDDGAYLIDFNPRPYGSMALAIAAGLNLPAIWADLVLGRDAAVDGGYRAGVRFRAEERDVRALAEELRDGRRLHAITAALPRRGTAHAVLSLRDPAPSLGLLASARRVIRRSPAA
jgi:biotin carboxylase